jgi:hypothetical protein
MIEIDSVRRLRHHTGLRRQAAARRSPQTNFAARHPILFSAAIRRHGACDADPSVRYLRFGT